MDITKYALNLSPLLMQQVATGAVTVKYVSTLPESGAENIVYFIPDGDGGHFEYIWNSSDWVLFGSTNGQGRMGIYQDGGYLVIDQAPGLPRDTDTGAPPIAQTASGGTIAVHDSAERPLKSLRIFGKTETYLKNFFPYDEAISTDGFITFNADKKTFTIPQLASGNKAITKVFTLPIGEYKIGVNYLSGTRSDCYFHIYASNGSELADTGMEPYFELAELTEVYGVLRIGDGGEEVTGQFFITDANERVVEFSNVGDTGNIDVSVLGANLWEPYAISETRGGVTVTVDKNGTYTLNGICTSSINFTYTVDKKIPSGTYCLSDNAEGTFPNNTSPRTHVYFPDINQSINTRNDGVNAKPSITLTEPQRYQLRIRTSVGHEYVNCKLTPMFNIGNTTLPHEVYKEPQTLTVSAPNGLASVGDVRDEVDFGRGIFIQRITRGDEYTILETPIETPLTAEQIEAFKTLRSYYPNTSIINDSSAHMEVEYVADTKLYIDGKFAELSAAILNQS